MKVAIASGALLLVLFSASDESAWAVDSANHVMPGCREYLSNPDRGSGLFMQGICHGAIRAIGNVVPGICPPKHSTIEQGVRIVVQYIDSRPRGCTSRLTI
jgi:hypothetical protein